MQGVMNFCVEDVSEITGEEAPWRMIDKMFNRQKQGTVTGEPHRLVRPETTIVEMSDFIQRVIASAMRVAGSVIEQLEFSEYRDVHVGIQNTFAILKGRNFVVKTMLAQAL